MNYCKFGEGDVYCFHTPQGHFVTHVAENTGLKYDVARYCDENHFRFLMRLFRLRNAGYHIPEHAIERVRKELK